MTTTGCPVAHGDHQGYEPFAQHDPFPAYARLRENEPVFHDERTGYWVVSRYDDVRAVFGDWETFSSENAQRPVTPRTAAAQQVLDDGGFTAYSGMSARQPPVHTRIRRSASAAFTPRRFKALEPQVEAHVRDLLEQVHRAGGPVDLVPTFTNQLPVMTILSLLGVDVDHSVESFKRWSDSRSAMTWGHLSDEEQLPHAEALVQYWQACLDLVAAAHRDRPDSLVGDLVRAQTENPEGALDDHEIASVCYSLLFAGHETTTTLLGNAVRLLLTHRDQWERLVADPSLAPGAIEEALRFSPSIVAWRRLARKDGEVAGVRIPEGSEVLLLMGAANRDPSRFEDPEVFDIGRANAREHLAFGYGIHFCLGNKLAKMQSAIALRELAASTPDLRLAVDPDTIEFPDSLSMRAPVAVPVTW
ncbi:cytochrome P450 [Nocardioides sp. CFH 31398]|uniref:cytochrome P450 n=1 Tax=Nocardioides sp. CFH 31398 TaxID=2919579 RepID=UPI001F06453A|nr:cytochrome P450 [Nocardioides sp. CFH 31398]MCH1865508.1 cytochrome P450 [Nocardioides sp. CFH 31398]